MPRLRLSNRQKEAMYRDGYVILKKVVPEDMVTAARLRHYPDAVRESCKRNAAFTADGHMWPKPTLMKLAPGDAVIVHQATPHGATLIDGTDPRFMLYFRTTPKSRPQRNRRIYPEALCDIWLEWKGMRSYVKRKQVP